MRHKLAFKRKCTGKKLIALRNNWTAIVNLFVPRKQDGTADLRATPRHGTREIHVHKDGHKRYYGASGVLKLEKYSSAKQESN
tara:strand:+ start:82 stop:330 length:249 start_codon:yes stop_codon:yes gene_type:complete